jgi:glucose-1-phosphate cytidylyltransferase
MQVVILAGGLGTRISEETSSRPKPMIEIGGKPILWHIMKMYSAHGFKDFIICCGYKGYMIKEYFANYFLHMSDVTFDMVNNNSIQIHQQHVEPWKITLIDTGENTLTGGRLKRVSQYLGSEDFCFTYGDGLGDVDLTKLISFHRAHGKMASITAVQPPGRFGALDLDGNSVRSFVEKPHGDGMYINGGFFVLSRKVIELIDDDSTIWEKKPLEALSSRGELQAFKHSGFWQPMDTMRDKQHLEELWATGKAPWKMWS